MADLEEKALDKETLDEIKSELEETKKIIKGIGIHRQSESIVSKLWVVYGSPAKTESLIKLKNEMSCLKIWMIRQTILNRNQITFEKLLEK